MIENVKYTYMNWGPFVLKTKLPNYVIKELLIQGKKAKQSYNKSLAGHLKDQFLYPVNVQNWFYTLPQPVLEKHCRPLV